MSTLNKTLQAGIFRIVFYHLMIIMGFTVVLICLKGIKSGLSAFGGALSYWLPTFIFLWRVSAYAGANAIRHFIIAFFAGEAIKLFLSGMLFLIIIKYAHAQLLYAVTGLVVSIIAFWIVSWGYLYQSGTKL